MNSVTAIIMLYFEALNENIVIGRGAEFGKQPSGIAKNKKASTCRLQFGLLCIARG